MPASDTNRKQQEWKDAIERQSRSSLSIPQWCKKHQVNRTSFYSWKKKLFPVDTMNRADFVEVQSKST